MKGGDQKAASNWLQDERLGLVGFAVSVLVRFDGGLLALADRVDAAGGARCDQDDHGREEHGGVEAGFVVALAGLVRDLRGVWVVHHDGLAIVLDVLMDCDHVAVDIEAVLECHQLNAFLDLGGIELEGDVNGSAWLVGGELRRCGHRFAVGVLQRQAGGLDHQRAVGGVSLARDKALVLDGVGQLHLAGDDDVVAVAGIDEGGADLDDGHGLALVGRILVGGELDIRGEELLVDHEALAAKAGAVEGDLHDMGSVGFLGNEGRRAGHLLLGEAFAHGHGLAGLGIDQGCHKRVLGAGDEALVGNLVDHGDLGSGH